jgi:aldehyde:ferredoxin oxidoreductase
MKTEEIQELIDAYQQVADNTFYTDNTRRAALRKVNSLREELGMGAIELKKVLEAPKAPIVEEPVTGIKKWFK